MLANSVDNCTGDSEGSSLVTLIVVDFIAVFGWVVDSAVISVSCALVTILLVVFDGSFVGVVNFATVSVVETIGIFI